MDVLIWNRPRTTKLIQLFRENVCLWHTHHPEFLNKEKTWKTYEKIGKIVGCRGNVAEMIVGKLKSRFQAENQKLIHAKNEEANKVLQIKSQWEYFDALNFLNMPQHPNNCFKTETNSKLQPPNEQDGKILQPEASDDGINNMLKRKRIDSETPTKMETQTKSELQSPFEAVLNNLQPENALNSIIKRKRIDCETQTNLDSLESAPIDDEWSDIGNLVKNTLRSMKTAAVRDELAELVVKFVFSYKAKDREQEAVKNKH